MHFRSSSTPDASERTDPGRGVKYGRFPVFVQDGHGRYETPNGNGEREAAGSWVPLADYNIRPRVMAHFFPQSAVPKPRGLAADFDPPRAPVQKVRSPGD